MQIILASESPRRKEILGYFSLPFQTIPSCFDESLISFIDPRSYVKKLAEEKGKFIANMHPNAIVVSADTIVFIDGKALGKPRDVTESALFLQTLSGRWHSVYTGVAVTCGPVTHSDYEVTNVACNNLSPSDIKQYIKAHNPQDKAGGYSIQKSGYLLINKIEGCFYNAMGLPINTLRKLLLKFQIDLWNYLENE